MVMLPAAPAEGGQGDPASPPEQRIGRFTEALGGRLILYREDRNNRVAPADSRPSVLGAESRLDGHADSTALGGVLATGVKGRGGGGGKQQASGKAG